MRKTKTESYELVKDLISKKDFEKEIKKRFDEYNQLLDEDAIAFLIVDEMGRNVGHVSTIRELKDGEEATIYAAVTKIFEPRVFEKNGRKGKVVNIEIKDETGECRLVLWDRDVELVENGTIKENTVLKVVNGYVKKTENWFEINVGKWGVVVPEPGDMPKGHIKINFTDLSDVKPGMNVNVTGTLIGKDGPRSFVRKNGSTGFVSNIILYDGKDSARVVLWDERAKETANLETGDNVEIINGYTKLSNIRYYGKRFQRFPNISGKAKGFSVKFQRENSTENISVAANFQAWQTRKIAATRKLGSLEFTKSDNGAEIHVGSRGAIRKRAC
ncbi:MAG: OB-fold nucleic acid binding domain-containing protein [Thermoplasmatales archaeon]|nr:OB-fold nucleic acid binding domain-containing protein [Thermoplasmatales archaeon]